MTALVLPVYDVVRRARQTAELSLLSDTSK